MMTNQELKRILARRARFIKENTDLTDRQISEKVFGKGCGADRIYSVLLESKALTALQAFNLMNLYHQAQKEHDAKLGKDMPTLTKSELYQLSKDIDMIESALITVRPHVQSGYRYNLTQARKRATAVKRMLEG